MFFRILNRFRKKEEITKYPYKLEGKFLSPDLFYERIRQERLRAERSNQPLSIVIISFNKLMSFFSHKSDFSFKRLFQHFEYTMKKLTRGCDIKGWISKDEFAILTPDTDDVGAQRFVENLAAHLSGFVKLKEDDLLSSIKTLFTIYCIEDDYHHFSISQGSNILWSCSQNFYRIKFSLTNSNIFQRTVSNVNQDKKITVHCLPFKTFSTIIKRFIDIFGCLIGIILFAPVMAFIATLIKLTSPGPVLYCQERVGFKGRPFKLLKFRSMKDKCDNSVHRDHLQNLIKHNAMETNRMAKENHEFKLSEDDRITPFGKFLRKTSLDELPQLFNVLKGDMSLVGPRPHPTYECELYKAWYWERLLEVKPGITGLWQVDGRKGATYDEQIRLDLSYARTWSIWFDFKILVQTIWAVISMRGAV